MFTPASLPARSSRAPFGPVFVWRSAIVCAAMISSCLAAVLTLGLGGPHVLAAILLGLGVAASGVQAARVLREVRAWHAQHDHQQPTGTL